MDLFHVCLFGRDLATFFFLPRSNSTHYHKRDLPLITQTNVGLLSLHFQLRRKAKSWLKMLSLLDILPTAGFEFQVISFTWPGSTELVGSNKCFLVLQLKKKKRLYVFCHQNCSDLLWEKNVLVIKNNFWNSRLKVENSHNLRDH